MKTTGLLLSLVLLGAPHLVPAAETPAPTAIAPSFLPFKEALNRILERSTTIGIQEATRDQISARNLPTRLSFLPTLALSAKQTGTQGVTATNGDSSTQRALEATSQLNLFRFGADVAAWRAIDLEDESQNALLESARLKTEEDAIAALLGEIQGALEISTLAKLVEVESQSLRIARQRYERGLLPQQEVDKVSIDLDNARARHSDALIRNTQARRTLLALLGKEYRPRTEWPWKEALTQGRLPPFLATENTDTPEGVPEVRSAQAASEAEHQRVSRAYRLLLPSVDTSLTYGLYSTPGSDSLTGWTGVLTVSLPLFDRLSGYSNARAQGRSSAAADLQLEQARRDAQAKWSTSKEAFELALQSALAREKTLSVSRKLYEDGIKRFQQGRVSTNDLLVDQSRLFDSEFFAIQSWSAAHLALSRLCHALGHPISDCVL